MAKFANLVESGTSLCDMVRFVCSDADADALVSSFDKYNHFIVAMSNQYDRRRAQFIQTPNGAHPIVDTDTGEVKNNDTWCGATLEEGAELYESAVTDV